MSHDTNIFQALSNDALETGEISGYKWNDRNGDGIWDADEPGLAGWTIYLDQNLNGQLDNGEISTITDENGNYAFTELTPGISYTVAEVQKTSWLQSFPLEPADAIVQLTDNIFDDYNPQISGNNVVWKVYDYNDDEIYFYNGTNTVQLTDNDFADSSPQISGNNVVWVGGDYNNSEIYFYNGSSTVQLTDNDFADSSPQISGNNVVWRGGNYNDYEIYFYNGTSTVQLTDNDFADSSPQISGNNVVWQVFDGNDYEIYFYNGTSTVQLTDNDFTDSSPQISGNNVVWQGGDYNDTEIYFYNGSIVQLTNNDLFDYSPQISGNNVVWWGEDSNDYDTEIYFYNGSSTIQRTDNNFNDISPQISGNNVVWEGFDGNGTEIFAIGIVGRTIDLDPGEVVTDINFGNWQPGRISGSKWEDLDGDGTRDDNEAGLGGWRIYLDANNNGQLDNGETSTITNGSGNYTFTLQEGTYTVAEVLKSGWTQTSPSEGSYTINLATNGNVNNINFGNRAIPNTISGSKWNDKYANGFKDVGEPGLAGWTIYLDQNQNGQLDAGDISTLTDANGNYTFTNLRYGTYTVAEVVQEGWIQTYGGTTLTLAPGENATDINFGNWHPVVISGSKWQDLDGDGTRDADEVGLAGWTIYLDANNNGQFDDGEISTVTDISGNYTFPLLREGTYTVAEVLKPGWIVTQPQGGSYTVSLIGGERAEDLSFGNQTLPGEISGYKWNDLNADGTWDADEPGLAGWTIYLDTNNNGQLDAGELSTVTDASGKYTFSNLLYGTYAVAEVQQTDWVQTAPQPGFGISSAIVQLTDDFYADSSPQISGNKVVWQVDDGNDDEIYFYNGINTIQLTDNFTDDYSPQISGNNVVWSGNYLEIYFYNGTSTVQLTHNSTQDYSPQISGNNVVWYGYDGNDYEIYFYNGTSTVQLSDNSIYDISPQISGNNVVWYGYNYGGDDSEIYFYNGTSTVQLTDNDFTDSSPQISGNNVVWYGYDGNDTEIYFYNGTKIIQLTNSDFSDYNPQISGNNVVWQVDDGIDHEIYFYNGTNTVQLTNNDFDDYSPQISGNNVVWYGYDGNDTEIYFYNGTSTVQFTDNSFDDYDPEISENNVTWYGYEGNSDSEIFVVGIRGDTVTLDPGEVITGFNLGNHYSAIDSVINGTPSNDVLNGTPVRDIINGNGGNDNISGLEGDDVLNGGTGNFDRLFGGIGNDTIVDPDGVLAAHGGIGDDTIDVTFAADWDNDTKPGNAPRSDGKISGGYGNDIITVTMNKSGFFLNLKGDEPASNALQDGNDRVTLLGTYGKAVVNLGGGDDIFTGGIGSDNISAGNGNDSLLGSEGNDRLIGQNGNDTLRGGLGNDRLTGGSDADIFVLADGEGKDTITDFQDDSDRIGLSGSLTFNDLTLSGNNIILGSQILATLSGFNTTTLTVDDFVSI